MTPEVEKRITEKLDELGGVPGFNREAATVSMNEDVREWWYRRQDGKNEWCVPVRITGRDYMTVRGNDELLMRLVACELEKARIHAEAALGY